MTMMSPTDYDDFARRYAAGRASVVAQFVSALENELGVRIHQNVLQSAAGS
jgi:hypothetical protein